MDSDLLVHDLCYILVLTSYAVDCMLHIQDQDQDPCHCTCTSQLWHSPASSLVDGELFPLCFAQGGGGRGDSSLVDGELFALCFAQGGGRGAHQPPLWLTVNCFLCVLP